MSFIISFEFLFMKRKRWNARIFRILSVCTRIHTFTYNNQIKWDK